MLRSALIWGRFTAFCINPPTTARRECCLCSTPLLLNSAAQLLSISTVDVVFLGAKDPDPTDDHHVSHSATLILRPEPPFGVGHSTISEKSFPYLGEGIILTHMVPDLARWQIRVRGVLLFGTSERPLNHPGADLDDPMVPML